MTGTKIFRIPLWFICIVFLFLLIVVVFFRFGLGLNLTPSMPMGIWQETNHIIRGAFITFCLPEDNGMHRLVERRAYLPQGKCSDGFAPLLKQIVAMPGDLVDVTQVAIKVNGKIYAHSKTLLTDSKGRDMPYIAPGQYKVTENTYWVLAIDHPNSLDSRYFGAIPKSAILHAMKPVAIFYRYHFQSASH